jgi:hypothetical protein
MEGSATCAHAAVDFEAFASAMAVRQLLLAVDAQVMYGPDEFGRFQVRLAAGSSGPGMEMLRRSALVRRLESYTGCM